jgi:predicted Zn-dependent peptidase
MRHGSLLAMLATASVLGSTLPAAAQQAGATPNLQAARPSPTRQQPPPPAPERPFAFPKHSETKLENGLTVFVVRDDRQPVVTATLMVPGAGAASHEGSKAGLASMTAELLRQGTSARSAQQIAEAIDRVGGSLSANAGADSAEVSVTVMTTALETGFELLADVVQRPAFADDEIERWRRQALSGLQVAYNDPSYLRTAVARRLAYGDHPYAYQSEGYPRTVASLSREDVAAFHRDRYTPSGSYLAVAGDITPDAALALARKHFGAWQGASTQLAQAPAATPRRRVVVVDKPDAVQTQFGVVSTGVPRNHADWLPLAVANQVLGGGFNSRLNMRLRAQEGLTYDASSAMISERQAGFWSATSFTRTEETGRAIEVALDVIREFRRNPARPEELGEATSYLSGVFAIQTETAGGVAGRVLTSALHGLPPDYWQTYRERVRQVSAKDVAAAVERHLSPDQLSVVAVGNASGFVQALEPLGGATVVPLARLDLTQAGLVAPQETAAGPEAGQKGTELIEAAADAAGGQAALVAVKDATTIGTVTINTPGGEMSGDVRSMVEHPDKVKVVITLPVGEVVQVFDGRQAWMRMGPQPPMELPAPMHDEMRRAVLLNGGIGVLREALEGRAEVAALEPSEVDGRTLDRVSWKKGELEMVLGLDRETHHVVHVSYRGLTPQGPADSETRLSDHQPAAGGLTVPMRSATYQNGQKAAEVVVKEWRFNTGIPADTFAKPQ